MRAQRAPENARLQQASLGRRRVAVALKRSGQPLPGHQRVLHVGRDALHRRAERLALAGDIRQPRLVARDEDQVKRGRRPKRDGVPDTTRSTSDERDRSGSGGKSHMRKVPACRFEESQSVQVPDT